MELSFNTVKSKCLADRRIGVGILCKDDHAQMFVNLNEANRYPIIFMYYCDFIVIYLVYFKISLIQTKLVTRHCLI